MAQAIAQGMDASQEELRPNHARLQKAFIISFSFHFGLQGSSFWLQEAAKGGWG